MSTMKRIFFFLIAVSLCGGRELRAQTRRRKNVNNLTARADLLEDKAHQKKQIESLSRWVLTLGSRRL